MDSAPVVQVSFIDADSGECFAQSDVPADRLPESFEARTTVNLGGQDWEVTAAEPMTRAECQTTGRLRLTLRRIQVVTNIPADQLLYSLPTICDAIPPTAPGTTKIGRRVLQLHEDDWRQIELVSRSLLAEVRAGLARIERIFAVARTPEGAFRDLHLRTEVAAPLEGCRLAVAEIRTAFGPSAVVYEGLGYRDAAGLVDGGFALRTAAGMEVYGQEHDGVATALSLLLHGAGPGITEDAPALTELMRGHDLCLVDWCAVQVIEDPGTAVADYLKSWARP
jgi:hypothetical protein